MIAPPSPPPEARSAAGPSAIAYAPPKDFKKCKYCPVPIYIHSKSMYRHVKTYHAGEYVPTRNKGTSSRALARRKSQGEAKAAGDSSEEESESEDESSKKTSDSSKKTSDSAKKKSDSAKKKKYTPRKTSRNVKSGDESGSSKKAKKAKSADDDDEGPSSRKKAKSGDDEGPSSIKKAKSSKKEESGDQQQDQSTDSDPLMSQNIADRNARLVGLRRSGRITVKYCHFILIVTMLPVSELVTYLLTYLLTYCSQQLAYF